MEASVVVIGAGIQGNCVAHHLALLGWRDIVPLDMGPFPNPGGSTGHASNFLFPVDHSKEMTKLTQATTPAASRRATAVPSRIPSALTPEKHLPPGSA
jgi:glycine/D-amino acid oxidase-like deaminating enzyme